MDKPDGTDAGESPQSFVVRIWIEEPARGSQPASWRGHVTHIPDGERRYFEDLDAIATFIRPYLERMGARFRRRSSLWRRLFRR